MKGKAHTGAEKTGHLYRADSWRWMWQSGSRGEANKLFKLWNWRGSKCQWVINKSWSLPVARWSGRCITLDCNSPVRQHQENTAICSVCVYVCGCIFVNTLNTLTEGHATIVSHENWRAGSLNPYWPAHFPRTLVSVCVFVCVQCNVGD